MIKTAVRTLLVLICLSLGISAFSQFKIVGYYAIRSAISDGAKGIPLKKFTHINLWFLNPDTSGNFSQDYSGLSKFIDAAHKRHVKVLFSIAGGSPHPIYHRLLKDDRRAEFVRQLVEQVTKYGLDGLDVDLEGGDIDDNYEAFVVELTTALHAKQKLVTAAVAIYYKEHMSDRALAQYDFINVMSYDRTGPWRPDKPGPHSTLKDAEDDLSYFGGSRGVTADRMTLGVPFYGYGFGPDSTSKAIGMDYKDIVSKYSRSEFADEWKMADGKILYYNGIPTMKLKARLARAQASGIMIWQIKGDAKGKKSLVKAIRDGSRD